MVLNVVTDMYLLSIPLPVSSSQIPFVCGDQSFEGPESVVDLF